MRGLSIDDVFLHIDPTMCADMAAEAAVDSATDTTRADDDASHYYRWGHPDRPIATHPLPQPLTDTLDGTAPSSATQTCQRRTSTRHSSAAPAPPDEARCPTLFTWSAFGATYPDTECRRMPRRPRLGHVARRVRRERGPPRRSHPQRQVGLSSLQARLRDRRDHLVSRRRAQMCTNDLGLDADEYEDAAPRDPRRQPPPRQLRRAHL